MLSKAPSAKDLDVDLQSYGLIFKRRWPIALTVCVLTTILAGLYAQSKADTYEAKAKLLVESSSPVSSLIGIEGGDRELKALTSQNNPLDTQVEIFNSIPVAQTVIEKLNIRDKKDQLIDPEDLLEDLGVSGIPGTDVLWITYEHTNPQFAALVVNTAIDVYLEKNIQESRADAAAAKSFIAGQLPDSEIKVSRAESALRQFKERNGIVDLDTEASNTVEVLTTLDTAVTRLKADLSDTNARAASFQNQLRLNPKQAYAVGLVSESPGVQEVLTRLQTTQGQLAVARTRYRDNHPEIVSIVSKINALNALLNRRIDATVGNLGGTLPADDLQSGQLEQTIIADYLQLEAQSQGLSSQLEELASAWSAQQDRAQVLPGLEEQQRELSRKLTAAQTTYETLLENLQQAQIIENQDADNARIVSPAMVPDEPSNAPKLLYLLAGGMAGALLGTMLACLVDFLDQSIKTVRQGQELYGYPLIGVIPAWRKIAANELEAPQLILAEHTPVEHPEAPLIEAYQGLQSNLKFSYFDKPLKSIVVSSAVAGEGKSEVAANLALTLSQLGHKVLVIDTDMRSPAQQTIWNISTPQGLSDIIAGQVSLKQAIFTYSSHLYVLPAGSIPPNPLAVLESKQMAKMLCACEKVYDYVIIDTPPILGLSDTPTVGRLADGMLVVMQTSRCDIRSLKAAKAILAQSRQRVLGVVANGVKLKSRHDRYFYHAQEYVSPNSEPVGTPTYPLGLAPSALGSGPVIMPNQTVPTVTFGQPFEMLNEGNEASIGMATSGYGTGHNNGLNNLIDTDPTNGSSSSTNGYRNGQDNSNGYHSKGNNGNSNNGNNGNNGNGNGNNGNGNYRNGNR